MEHIIPFLIAFGIGIPVIGGIIYTIWNEYHQKKLINQKVSDKQVLEIARENYGKLNVPLLCERLDLSAKEAKIKLKCMAENKLIVRDWKNIMMGGSGYVLPDQNNNLLTRFFNTKGSLLKRVEALLGGDAQQLTASPTTGQNRDAQIISLALENQGIITASAVCVKLNITIDEAQRKLEELRQKQIFITEAGQGGGLVYRLLDV